MNFAQEILKIEMSEGEYVQIIRDISNWQKVQLLFDNNKDEDDFLCYLRKALQVEMKTKRRWTIIKRLHQGYHNLVRQRELKSIMDIV